MGRCSVRLSISSGTWRKEASIMAALACIPLNCACLPEARESVEVWLERLPGRAGLS
jgi:hypothetical protein